VRYQLGATVEIPAENEHASRGLRDGGTHSGEIGRSVDENRETMGALEPPAIATGDEQPARRRFTRHDRSILRSAHGIHL
jgi:hypothetical protein